MLKGVVMDAWAKPIFVLCGLLFIFAICRELTCWYFKLSEISKKMDRLIGAIEGLKPGTVSTLRQKTE